MLYSKETIVNKVVRIREEAVMNKRNKESCRVKEVMYE